MFSLLVRLAWEDQMKKEKNTTPSGEDYLEAILILQRQKGLVRPVDIARHMEFSKPSITHAITTLLRGGFVEKDKEGKYEIRKADLQNLDHLLIESVGEEQSEENS